MQFEFSTDPCSTLECPQGFEVKVFPPTGEEYCDPSCDNNTGGCDIDEICVQHVGQLNCVKQLCLREVSCLIEGTVYMDVSSLSAWRIRTLF